jgi:hypothetical protein
MIKRGALMLKVREICCEKGSEGNLERAEAPMKFFAPFEK